MPMLQSSLRLPNYLETNQAWTHCACLRRTLLPLYLSVTFMSSFPTQKAHCSSPSVFSNTDFSVQTNNYAVALDSTTTQS